MSALAYAYTMSAHLTASGEDAADFLQSQFSNDLRPFSKGQCRYGLWLDVKGKIVADSWVYCEDDERFRIFSQRGDAALIRNKLETHIVADDVELELDSPLVALSILGGCAGELMPPPGVDYAFPGRSIGGPGMEWIFGDNAARETFLSQGSVDIVSEDRMLVWGMNARRARVHMEALPGDMPGECGLVGDAVSLTKGCYLGQEVVARMHNVGRPQRGLYLLQGSGVQPEALSPVANTDGKQLGQLRTCVADAAGWRGVAMLKSRFVEPGMPLALDGQHVRVEAAYG